MPRYSFRCIRCDLEFEVSRPMSEAGRAASCPADGVEAERVFTAPMTAVRQGEGAVSAGAVAGEGAARSWSSPFFPKRTPGVDPPRASTPPRHVLPPGSSKPARFRHFGHWHPAGTPPHTHAAGRPAASLPKAPSES